MFDTELPRPRRGPPTLDRWVVDLADGKVRESRIDDRGQGVPRVDERLVGKRHRYGYAPAFGDENERHRPAPQARLLSATDRQTRAFGAGKQLGEFVSSPALSADAAEDDGVLMGYVYDAASDRSELAIIDAQTLEDVATVSCRTGFQLRFHGNWVPSV